MTTHTTYAIASFVDRYRGAYRDDSEVLAALPSPAGAPRQGPRPDGRDGSRRPDGRDGRRREYRARGRNFAVGRVHVRERSQGADHDRRDEPSGTTGAVIGETTSDADVPYGGDGLTNTQTNPLDRERAAELLSSSDLPPGL
ncbi:hypothetical protein [Halorientalis marina]|uniref:hypothetical protein n=1 Tax=Halorientalis marina TaxID=2931976 RepID=UPI001FF69A26|nr:hypothetical protein [Halorientalis marina]